MIGHFHPLERRQEANASQTRGRLIRLIDQSNESNLIHISPRESNIENTPACGKPAREVEKRETKCPYAKTPFARISHKVGNTRVCGKSRRARRGTRASTRLGRETWNVRFARVQSKQRETPRAPNSAAAQCLRRAGKHPRVRDIERSEN